MQKPDYDELWAAVQGVARGCRGCPRSGGQCSVCDRSVCRGLVLRMAGAVPVRLDLAPAGGDALPKASPLDRPCAGCEHAGSGGKCALHGSNRAYCVKYARWSRLSRAARGTAGSRGGSHAV